VPPPPRGIPPVIVGDRRGRTAAGWLTGEAVRVAQDCGFAAAINEPFAGGHVIERHARPHRGIHALQIEIDRRCYLDSRQAQPGTGFDAVAVLFERLAVELGEALIRSRLATAAE